MIVEPLIQGAGGMRMYHPVYLSCCATLCDALRRAPDRSTKSPSASAAPGRMFACEQAGIRPDFLCLSKALTGGYLPLAAVLTTDDVYSAFYDDYQRLRAFLHSHSYTGNPLACAAALATLDIFSEDNVIENNKPLASAWPRRLAHLVDHPNVAEVRQTGMVAGDRDGRGQSHERGLPWQERRGLKVFQHALERGALLRPLGSVVYFLPPYVITEQEIDHLVDTAIAGIAHAVGSRQAIDQTETAWRNAPRISVRR